MLVCSAGFGASGAWAASGYMVNSDDPGTRDFDALHRIELSNGQALKIGDARASESQAPYADIEGLAMNAEGQLYGIDDASKTLLRIDQLTGRATPVDGREGNTGLPRNVNFDFGLTFDCAGALYASSDSRRSLYRLDSLSGVATLVGAEGSLGAQITGLAARYDGVYGIGSNGDENLYRIDATAGTASVIGALGAGLRYADAGLDFDAAGQLWGVADMTGTSVNAEPSVLIRINPDTGAAERVATTLAGVESLAISKPMCDAPQGVPLPPAIPALDARGLALLALLLSVLGAFALRQSGR
jgi:hypothetical protein